MSSLFGSPLVNALARSSFTTPSGLSIPGILGRCFHEIEEKGLDIEGIFRKSGSTATVNQLQTQFEETHNPFLVELPPTISTHSLAALFKRYLQQLPEPVIPRHFQPLFINVFDEQKCTKETLKRRLKEICSTLPREHLHLLQFLLQVAHSVQQHQDKNQMSIESLAIIFAPTCIRMDAVSQLLPNSKQYNNNSSSSSSSRSSHAFNTSKSCSSLPVMLNKYQLFRKVRELLLGAVVRKKQQLLYRSSKSSTETLLYKPNELLQHQLVRESNTWTRIFKFMMSYPEVFTTLTTTPPPLQSQKHLALPTDTNTTTATKNNTTAFSQKTPTTAMASHSPSNTKQPQYKSMDSLSLWTSPFSQQEKKMLIDFSALEFTDSHIWIKTFEDYKKDHQQHQQHHPKESSSSTSLLLGNSLATKYIKTLQSWKTREEENPTIVIPQQVILSHKRKTAASRSMMKDADSRPASPSSLSSSSSSSNQDWIQLNATLMEPNENNSARQQPIC